MYRKKERASKEERTTLPQRRRTQSFSSSLLDAIYRSIDEDPALPNEETLTSCKKQSNSVPPSRGRAQFLGEEDNNNNNKEKRSLRRAIMVETWMERQKSQRTTSSSSGSSLGGGGRGGLFSSSSEAGSSSKGTPRPGNGGGFQGLENEKQKKKKNKKQPDSEKGHHHQGLDFTRTKLRALKIYGELKKVKQPISPGGRISSFLNSIFSPGSATKKVKMCSIGAMEDVTKHKSSSSSSCLSKTPTPGRRSKRSVRFYPVSVIVGEDSRPCGHKYIYGGDKKSDPLVISKESKNKKKKLSVNVHFPSYLNYDGEEDEEEEDEDDMSCSSSELFEIDHHLIGIGNGRYREELPVYETTSLKTNQAIVNGFFV